MTNSNPIGVYLPISEVFPDIKSDVETFKNLLHSLSRTDTLFWCARLNNIISHSSEIDHVARQQFGVSQFFSEKEIRAVNDFVSKKGNPDSVMIFFRGQLLELMRWVVLYCIDHPGDGTTYEDQEVRRTFAKAALIASDIWAKRVFGNRLSLDGGIAIAREKSLGAIRKSIEDNSKAPDLSRSLGRGWALFSEYFPRYYASFEKEFASSFGLSIEQYYICLCSLVINFTTSEALKNKTGLFDVNSLGKATPYSEIVKKYIEKESQTPDEIKDALWGEGCVDFRSFDNIPPYNYRSLRERPILRSNDGRGIILDLFFYSEKALIGPLFHILRDGANSNRIFGAFGDSFESYACDILRRVFPESSSEIAKRLYCNMKINAANKKGASFEIDACLDDVSEVVILEMKAVWIREDKILTEDYATFLEHLRERYGISSIKTEDRKVKGVGQLARIIELIAKENRQFLDNSFNETKIIYPILLVHDPLLNAPVFGDFLASEFKAYIKPDDETRSGQLKKGRFIVHPLIILTVEDLENLETSLEHFGFRDLLSDYSRECPDRIVSVHNYIATSEYGEKLYHNRWLPGKAIELIDKTMKTLFSVQKE